MRRLLTSVLLVIIGSGGLLGCDRSPKPPDAALIRTAVESIVDSTRFGVAYSIGQYTPARLSLETLDVIGTSVQGPIAQVKTRATVAFHKNGVRVSCWGPITSMQGRGLAQWYRVDGSGETECQDGRKVAGEIDLVFRLFDSGWKLQSSDH